MILCNILTNVLLLLSIFHSVKAKGWYLSAMDINKNDAKIQANEHSFLTPFCFPTHEQQPSATT